MLKPKKWEGNLRTLVGPKMHNDVKSASVSEYGMPSSTELFAEVGAAVVFGSDTNPDLKMAFEKTIEGISR